MARQRIEVIDGTDSVVPHAARHDFTFARQELTEGDLERVRAGMELLSWTYDEVEWCRHVTASAARLRAAESEDDNLVRKLLFGKGRAAWASDRLEELPLPTVVLTSTGILFGEIARLWRGRRRLAHATVEQRDPRYLVLTFEKRWMMIRWAVREMWVPVPEPLERDLGELTEMINSFSTRGVPRTLTPGA